MSRLSNIRRLLSPKSIAVVGGREAAEVIRQCRLMGYSGDIWPVNPKRETLGDLACFADIASLPSAPDAAFIAIPRGPAVETIAQLAERGAGGAVCYASGFSETSDGHPYHEALLAKAGDLAVVGPNCYGLLNYLDGAALWPDQHGGEKIGRGVAIISQSGNIGISLTMQERSLPLSYMISVGNQTILSFADYIEALCEDDRVTAIGLHVEGIDDIPAFCRAVEKARQKRVPIIVLKAGGSEIGAQLTMSHTSSLAGSDTLYSTLFNRIGVARVFTLSELIETLKFLHVVGPAKGTNIASLSCSGGEAALMADLGSKLDLQFGAIPEQQKSELQIQMGEKVTVSNPFDYHTYIWGNLDEKAACFTRVMQGGYDVTLLVLDYPKAKLGGAPDWDKALQAMISAQEASGGQAAVISTLPENLPEYARVLLLANGVVPLQGLEDGLKAIKSAAWIGRCWNEISAKNRPTSLRTCQELEGRVTMLDEATAKRLLSGYGLKVPKSKAVAINDAGRTAEEIGFPVVVKAVSADLAHKTEAGGVALNLTSVASVQAAAVGMAQLSDRVLVEQMVTDSVAEIIIGVTRDPQFGLSLVIGTGGVLVELIKDSCALLLPASRDDIHAGLRSLKLFPLMNGYRGKARGDIPALLDAVEAVARFVVENDSRLAELDINPVMVLPEGRGVIVADAMIRMAEREKENNV
ncbi:acetate--CoA ligase family protein [Kiloniella laminariae]|uniref:Acetate--CoA ligase family protein n=1 Tax=Kiloniella laminariae TaxID=454162 RepID=A0ABT4LG40_9PROT|nr:acetate--CoA ligase family protein [Kiloniella laminariae]MCZ4280071.1 acetate--CoA ligase family protein [Kiloniella laminariae]